jgi:adenine-specific DNA-methyltransferase
MLTNDGIVFISIDDNELFNLKKLCDEVFGASNFIAQLAVQLNPRGRNLDVFVAKTYESVLMYAMNYTNNSTVVGVEKEGKMVDEYNREDEQGKYRPIGLRNRNQAFNPQTRPNLYYLRSICMTISFMTQRMSETLLQTLIRITMLPSM